MSADARTGAPSSAAGELQALRVRVLALIERLASGATDDTARDALLGEVLRAQREAVAPYDRLVAQLATRGEHDPLRWPALPTDVFRFARVATHAPDSDLRAFRTSGTTDTQRGVHCLPSLELYDRAAQAAARYALFADVQRMRLCVLAPAVSEAPDSSLSYMLDRFATWFGEGPSCHLFTGGVLDADRLAAELKRAVRDTAPLALLGTSFAFVHAEDALGARQFKLPAGSRIMQTGGFKGRSRTVEPAALLEQLAARYGIGPAWIVQEYGMTELSSQLYETTLRDAALGQQVGPRRLWWPGWVRVTLTDPETLAQLPAGATGLVRIDDLANVDTAAALQTSDLGQLVDGGLRVLGRATGATPRGCSLAVDAVLGARP